MLAQTEGPESGCFLRCDSSEYMPCCKRTRRVYDSDTGLDAVCGHAMLMHDGGVMVVKDVDKDWRFKNNVSSIHSIIDGRSC